MPFCGAKHALSKFDAYKRHFVTYDHNTAKDDISPFLDIFVHPVDIPMLSYLICHLTLNSLCPSCTIILYINFTL